MSELYCLTRIKDQPSVLRGKEIDFVAGCGRSLRPEVFQIRSIFRERPHVIEDDISFQ
jgi:hypothetical protein